MVLPPSLNLAQLQAACEVQPLLKLSLRAITPVYLGGANQAAVSDQASSVRGNVHWWLRALLGSLAENGQLLSIAKVAKLEASVLGTTNWSPRVQIGLSELRANAMGQNLQANEDTYSWLGWAMKLTNRNPCPATRFAITVTSTQLDPTTPEAKALAGAIWCWANLGALGSRSRRGFGALRISKVEGALAGTFADWCQSGADCASVWQPPESTERADWEQFLATGLDGAGRAAAQLAGLSPLPVLSARSAGAVALPLDVAGRPWPPLPRWSAFSPGHWRLLVIDPTLGPYKMVSYKNGSRAETVADEIQQPAWANALAALASRLRAVRRQFPIDRDPAIVETWPDLRAAHQPQIRAAPLHSADLTTILGAVAATPPIDLQNDEFGLPWPWKVGEEKGNVGPTNPGFGRRASPLLARPVAFDGAHQHVGLLFLALRAEFLPHGTNVAVAGTGEHPLLPRRVSVRFPARDLPQIAAFMDWVANPAYGTVLADLPS